MQAAIRELREETGLVAYDAKYLFSYLGSKHKTFSGKHYSIFLDNQITLNIPNNKSINHGYNILSPAHK